jgi:hypothetical protein
VQIAEGLNSPVEDVRAAMERLASGRAIVLQPESRELLLANPLSAVPTPFAVHVAGRLLYGACIWDALGIPAMLGQDAVVHTSCACCGEAMSVEIRDGLPRGVHGIIHFALPARRWWENIAFT